MCWPMATSRLVDLKLLVAIRSVWTVLGGVLAVPCTRNPL